GDHRVEVRGEVGRDAGQALAVGAVFPAVLRRVRGLHDDVGPLGEANVIRGIDAEKVGDHRRRDGSYVVGHQIAATARDDLVEQIVAQRSDEGLDPADPMLRDRGVDDPADLAVTRLGDLADELLLGRYHYAGGPETRLEHLDVLRGRKNVVMTGEEVRARRRPRNR